MTSREYYRVRIELPDGEHEDTRYYPHEWLGMLKYITSHLYSGSRVIEIRLMNYHTKEGD